MTCVVDECVAALLKNTRGGDIVHKLRTHFKTVNSLNTNLSHVRMKYLRQLSHPSGYDESVATLRRKMQQTTTTSTNERDRVEKFLSLPLRHQYCIKQAHQRRVDTLTTNVSINEMIDRIPLVPTNFKELRLRADEQQQCRQVQRSRREIKNASVRMHTNPQEMLDHVKREIQSCSESTSHVYSLGAALLAASGRRFIEIFNCRSTFEPVQDYIFAALFTGQAKKRNNPSPPYVIPLLVPYKDFNKAYEVFKTIQSSQAKLHNKVAPCDRTNEELEGQNRFLRTWLTRTDRNTNLRSQIAYRDLDNVKNFREIYLQYVKHLFDIPPWSDNYLSQKVHGHDGLETSLAYVNTRQTWNTPPVRLGVYPDPDTKIVDTDPPDLESPGMEDILEAPSPPQRVPPVPPASVPTTTTTTALKTLEQRSVTKSLRGVQATLSDKGLTLQVTFPIEGGTAAHLT